jgi:hypothetical protein
LVSAEVEGSVRLQSRIEWLKGRSGLRWGVGVEDGSGCGVGDDDEELEEEFVREAMAASRRDQVGESSAARDQVGESSAARELEERDMLGGAVKEDEEDEQGKGESWVKEVTASFSENDRCEISAPRQGELTGGSTKRDDAEEEEEEEWVKELLASFAEDEAGKNNATKSATNPILLSPVTGTEDTISSESPVHPVEQVQETTPLPSSQQAQSHITITSYNSESSKTQELKTTISNPDPRGDWQHEVTAASVLKVQGQGLCSMFFWESNNQLSEAKNIAQNEPLPEPWRARGPISFLLEAQLKGLKSLNSSKQNNSWKGKGKVIANEPSNSEWQSPDAVSSSVKVHIASTSPYPRGQISADATLTIDKDDEETDEDEMATRVPKFALRHAGPNIASREGKSGAALEDPIHRHVSIADHLMGHLNSFLIQNANPNINPILHNNIANNTVSAPTTVSTSSFHTKSIVRNIESTTTASDRAEGLRQGSDLPTHSPTSSRWSFPPTEELMPAVEGVSSEATHENNDKVPMKHQARRAELEDLLSGQKADLHIHMWSNDVRSHSMDALREGQMEGETSEGVGEVETDTDRVARLKSKIAFWKKDGSPAKDHAMCEDQPKYNGKMPTVPMFVRDVEDVPEEHWGKMEEVWARDAEARLQRDGWNGKPAGRLRRLMNTVGLEARETKFTRSFMKERSCWND